MDIYIIIIIPYNIFRYVNDNTDDKKYLLTGNNMEYLLYKS